MEIFGAKPPFYGWHYPPFFLAVAAALALMPYQLALIVWQVVTLGLYLMAVRSIMISSWPGIAREDGRKRPDAQPSTSFLDAGATDVDARQKAGHDGVWVLLALAYPAVFVNLGHGHNGFLTRSAEHTS